MTGPTPKILKNALGEFTETSPDVYVSTKLPAGDLTITKSVAINGTVRPINWDSNTVVVSIPDDVAHWNAHPESDTQILLEGYTQLEEWANITRAGINSSSLSTTNEGPSALQTNEISGGIVKLATDEAQMLTTFAGLGDISEIKIPKAYLENFNAAVAVHERGHLRDRETTNVLAGEIKADLSLREEFNKPFTEFVDDMRALGALNGVYINPDGSRTKNMEGTETEADHATHIWSEEVKTGIMPTEDQAETIGNTPYLIQQRVLEKLSMGIESKDNLSPKEAANIAVSQLESSTTRYNTYKTMREMRAFDDIPYANEFIDKYIKAGEKWYTQDVKEGGDPQWTRDRSAPAPSPQIAPSLTSAQPSPAASLVSP